LQPLVENAIKHGVSNAKRGGEVRIAARVEADNLTLEVADTGAGFEEASLTRGIGLNNVENRLKAYFGASARLTLTKQTPSGAIARIVFPVAEKISAKAGKNL
jgi:sensor histidine kinase YesM